ncbi:MAG: LysM peptidoglycan-binding domain-containing protein [Akkermansiaceae bacterium]
MKKNEIQTKRKTQKGFRAMYARTVGKKVKASAAASADELDGDVPNVGIGKALTVILILHVLAIMAIYVGTQWKDDEGKTKSNAVAVDLDNKSAEETGESSNSNAGTVYLDTPSSYDLDNNAESNSENGDAMNDRPSQDPALSVEPRRRTPRVIKPRRDPNKAEPMFQAVAVASYGHYKIKSGDTFYRLAKKYNVKQQDLIDMNPNVNASKMKIGMIVNVPKN